MSNNQTAKIKLKVHPLKKDKAWQLNIVGHHQLEWIPYSCISSYQPATLKIEVECWVLDQKGIKYTI